MNHVQTWELNRFLTVAEELHFGRAANRLGMAQPPLSRSIAKLERRLGVRLFDRTTRSVALTPAGEVLRDESRAVLGALERAVSRTRAAGRTQLRIVAIPGVGSGALRRILDTLSTQSSPPSVELSFSSAPLARLRAGSADLAIGCDTEPTEGLSAMVLHTERPVVLVPTTARLARSGSVQRAELESHPSFEYPTPPLGLDEILSLVALDRLLPVVGEAVRDRLPDEVAAVPVEGFPPMRVVIAWTDAFAADMVQAAGLSEPAPERQRPGKRATLLAAR